jgi:hypothetical protein
MRSIRGQRFLIVGMATLLFGFFCLNYTKLGTVDRHTAFAADHRLPPPSRPIFYGGVVAVAIGAGAIGYAIGARSFRKGTS